MTQLPEPNAESSDEPEEQADDPQGQNDEADAGQEDDGLVEDFDFAGLVDAVDAKRADEEEEPQDEEPDQPDADDAGQGDDGSAAETDEQDADAGEDLDVTDPDDAAVDGSDEPEEQADESHDLYDAADAGQEEADMEEAGLDEASPLALGPPGGDSGPAEDLDLAGLDVPDGKRGCTGLDIDEAELKETYELPGEGEDAVAWQEDTALDAPDDDGFHVQAHAGSGVPRILKVANALVALGVVCMLAIWWWSKQAVQEVPEEDSPRAIGHEYVTERGSAERAIEDALVPLELGKGGLASIKRAAGDPKTCEVVLNLPNIYFDQDAELRPDAERKAVGVVRSVFNDLSDVETVSFSAMFKFDLSDEAEPEVALRVVATRAQHAAAAYGEQNARETLRAFKTQYHKSIADE